MQQKREKSDEISQIISLIFSIRKLMHCKTGRCDKNISSLQLITLRFISEEKPLMKDLADYLTITPPSATSVVDTLMRLGLVKREEDDQDRRLVRIIITKKGQEKLDQGLAAVSERMRKGLEKLDKKEQGDMIRILEKVISGL